jgi:hypothetical protein
MNGDLKLHIVLQTPPANAHFGLQKGSGNNYETVQTQRSTGQDLYFNFSVEIKGDRSKNMPPDFKGPFVQGPAMGRFVYIDIGSYAGKEGPWNRRLKIPLTGITWELIDEVNAGSGNILQTHVPGTGKDGTPNCATVKPFEGWKIKIL